MLHRTTLLALGFFSAVIVFIPASMTGLVAIDGKLPVSRQIELVGDSAEAAPALDEPPTVAADTPATSDSVPEAAPVVPSGVTFETTLASYDTRYHQSGRHRGRAHNVERAAEKLDGAIIPPGGVLSFNDQVGRRDRANGFRRAMVIDGGELVPGMGGGVCQVASTLHAAALEGGLEMQDYRPHSRPSHYIPMGLDATVSYPQIDLVVVNPFEFPVLVQSRAVDGEMHVALVGQARPRDVEIARRVLNRRGYGRRIVEDPNLPAGARVVAQRGIRGARVERTRTITEDGETRVEREIVRYPPTDEIVRVGTTPLPSAHRLASADAPIGPLALR